MRILHCVSIVAKPVASFLPSPSLFLQGVDELAEWDGQCPPTAKHQKGKIITPRIKEVIGKVRTPLGDVCRASLSH